VTTPLTKSEDLDNKSGQSNLEVGNELEILRELQNKKQALVNEQKQKRKRKNMIL